MYNNHVGLGCLYNWVMPSTFNTIRTSMCNNRVLSLLIKIIIINKLQYNYYQDMVRVHVGDLATLLTQPL